MFCLMHPILERKSVIVFHGTSIALQKETAHCASWAQGP
jgi:hypothetical protein